MKLKGFKNGFAHIKMDNGKVEQYLHCPFTWNDYITGKLQSGDNVKVIQNSGPNQAFYTILKDNRELEEAQSLWSKLGDIPINELDELDEDFVTEHIIFEKGTDKFDVWSWFEDYFNVSVVKDLMRLK